MVHAGSSGCQDRPGPESSETPVRNQSLPLLIGTTPIKFDKFDKFEFEFTDVAGSSYALLKTQQSTESTDSLPVYRAQSFKSRSLAVAVCHCGQRGHLHNFQARFQARWELAVSLQAHCCPIDMHQNRVWSPYSVLNASHTLWPQTTQKWS